MQGFTVNATYTSPLTRSAVLNLTGTLIAKRAGGGSGRIYSQLVTVTDQAGNTASCTWTVTVPHDQANAITTAPNAGFKANKLNAFISAVNKSITPTNAAILIALARAL